ncbi:hypothetical protein LXA43DRAFT_1129135 [Ganoderma leucocontextum]|nr:hypothetical protein LXA43DRAFT_1129135 [Ganoderma leucocontextum]
MANVTEDKLAVLEDICLQDADAARRSAGRITDEISKLLETLPAGSGLRKRMFLQEIQSLRSKGRPAETIIAFCGETGAGKSSLINALLGENIVRTSGMAACTAVVTEIRYNPKNTIEAEIEYLTPSEWKDEVEYLLKDLKDTPDGHVKRRSDLVEEAAVAWEKIYAVYPSINEDMLSKLSAEQLLTQNSAVTLMLGNTARITVEESEPQRFTNELYRYLDPQDDPSTGSYWPLIRKVNIRYRSQVMSSGAVLVDLPGTADSNAARCKVAEDYSRRASRFFVVSPITRAVSSKVARGLCGEAFRTQLKLDGKYSPHAITFIATKCDELSAQEVEKEPALKPVLAKCEELKKIKSEIKTFQRILKRPKERGQAAPQAERQAKPGAFHIEIISPGSKRKAEVCDGVLNGVGKKQRTSAALNSATLPTQGQGQVASDAELTDLDLKNGSDKAWDLHAIKESLERCKVKRNRLLAKYRSNWSKNVLQTDFKVGLDEFDEDTLEGWTTADGDDRKLPVFTCSARDYMRIISKTPDDDSGPLCFSDEEDTEIPALSRWISYLTIPAREQASYDLFVQLKSLLTSVSEFVEGTPGVTAEDRETLQTKWRSREMEPTSAFITARERRAERYGSRPTSVVSRLIKSFEAVSDAISCDLDRAVKADLERKCHDSAVLAADTVLKISDDFASGTHWCTYRATLRRRGAFKIDLNSELATAFTRRIAGSWSHTFRVRRISTLEKRAMSTISPLLEELTSSVPEYLRPRAKRLQCSVKTVAGPILISVKEVAQKTWDDHLQRINRLLVPFVQSHLSEGYEQAAGVPRKSGVSLLQRKLFREHLEVKKDVMFAEAALALKQHLADAIENVRETLDERLEEVAKKVEVEMALLWDCALDSDDNIKARIAALATLREHKAEVERWIGARGQPGPQRDGNSESA